MGEPAAVDPQEGGNLAMFTHCFDRFSIEEEDDYEPHENREINFYLAIYRRAVNDLSRLPKELWPSWQEQIVIEKTIVRETTAPFTDERQEALKKVYVKQRRLRLARLADDWLFSNSTDFLSANWVREVCDIRGPVIIPDLGESTEET